MSPKQKNLSLAGSEIKFETGKYCEQANACVTAQVGGTMVMAVVTAGEPREGVDFLPLSVDYEERLYAAGRIKSSRYVKREGRPSDKNILTARLIDRSIRPLFPKSYRNEVQVVVTVLSYDGGHDPETIAALSVFVSLSISDIPWGGPLSCIRLTVNDEGILTPTLLCDYSFAIPSLFVTGNGNFITMIEGMLPETTNDAVIEGLEAAISTIRSTSIMMDELRRDWGKKKKPGNEEDCIPEQLSEIAAKIRQEINRFVIGSVKGDFTRHDFETEVSSKVLDRVTDDDARIAVVKLIDYEHKAAARHLVLDEHRRLDGRQNDEIRSLSMAIDEIPRAHGSSMFRRGETQVLNTVTLGSSSLQQLHESIQGEERKRYFHHYIAPPYSVGETGRIGSPGRREIGHGALAEKALLPVLPAEDDFPYAIRVVSEVLSQNGSSSMASVCASSLSLMAAGVPIRSPVAGIALGLMKDPKSDRFQVLTDIAGIEDFGGDMDFKVAGTSKGITAIQMDTKLHGITIEMAKEAIAQGASARSAILRQMARIISKPRGDVSQYAPKLKRVTVPEDLIGKIIGSGGKVIKRISEENNTDINIEDTGVVTISSIDQFNIDNVARIIKGITTSPKIGEIYTGKVVKLMDFGAFVEIFPGTDGLVHVSEMSDTRIKHPQDVVVLGDEVRVRLFEIDSRGRLNLSMRKLS